MGAQKIARYLASLASSDHVSASTQNQAFSALIFLYREVLGCDIVGLDEVARAKRPIRVPLVLTPEEVQAVLRRMRGTPRLMAQLLYGAGLRLLECCRLRVKDLDLARAEITVRDGKGRKDRVTVLPARLDDAVRGGATTYTSRVSSASSRPPCVPPHSPSPPPATRSGTRSQPTSSKAATTSGRSRSSSATATSARR